MKGLRRLFYNWAFLDINHTGSYKQTFFATFEDDNCMLNQEMISRLSLLLSLVSAYVLFFLMRTNPGSPSNVFHLVMMIVLLIFLYTSKMMTFRYSAPLLSNVVTVLFICLLYGITLVNQVMDFDLPQVLFFIVMALVPVAFVLPPILFAVLNIVFGIAYLAIVHGQVDQMGFYDETLAVTIVFAVSTVLGWYIGKTRAEQAFADQKNLALTKTLQMTSLTDQLTGLLNHRSFQSDYYELFKNSQQNNRRIGVIMIDIDKFKLFNDYYGHLEGDRCLSLIGSAIGEFGGEEINTYRFGGEEFVLLLYGASANRTIAVAESLRQKVYDMQITHEYSPAAPVVTVSVGVHLGTPPGHEKPMNFFDHADQAMYVSKRNGGNQVTVYHDPGKDGSEEDEEE